MTDLAAVTDFDVTIPLIRTDEDGRSHQRDINLRIPSRDIDAATETAQEIGWVIVAELPKSNDNNRHGWKIASYGVAVKQVAP